MQYYHNETIAFPFTAYYYGYPADLGTDPTFLVNLYSHTENQLIECDTFVEVKEAVAVGNDTLIIGIIFLNKLQNYLDIGDYRLKLSVQVGVNIIDLIYAPISIVANAHSLAVSSAARATLTPEELNYHLRDVIDPGVKNGFDIAVGAGYDFDIYPGVLFTADGVKIEHGQVSRAAIRIEPATDYSRIDIVCAYYDKDSRDEQDSQCPPEFRVLRGKADGQGVPPSVPPHHTKIAYAIAPPYTASPTEIQFSKYRLVPTRRPFFSVPSFDYGDGVRTRFEFPVEFVRGTTTVDVDGVPQYVGEDYTEVFETLGRGIIQFVGEVPGEGQGVYLSGQATGGPFYEYDYSLYPAPAAPTPGVWCAYSRVGLVAEFLASTLTDTFWPDSTGNTTGFTQTDPQAMPVRGWNNELGDYVNFDGNQYMTLADTALLHLEEFTIVIEGDMRESPVNSNWMRILTKKCPDADPSLSLIAINSVTDPKAIVCSGSSTQIELIPGFHWNEGPFQITISRNADGELTMTYNGATVGSTAAAAPSYSSNPWVLGAEEAVGFGSRFDGKITTILLYDDGLTDPAPG